MEKNNISAEILFFLFFFVATKVSQSPSAFMVCYRTPSSSMGRECCENLIETAPTQSRARI
jgi:hypothetical protein